MLGYYRNPINYIFFNESVIVCSLFSFGVDEVWKNGADLDDLFIKACYLAELIKREEVLKERITYANKPYFMSVLQRMVQQRMITIQNGPDGKQRIKPKSSGEATMLLVGSICWPIIDTYYIVLVFALHLCKKKDELDEKFVKDSQWIAETLFQEGKINYFESCNQPSINNAKAQLLEMKVLVKNSLYINLAPQYLKSEGEKRL